MSIASLEQQLDRIELQFNAVSLALIDGNPDVVQAASATLQQLAVHFLQMVDELGRRRVTPPQLSLRLKALAEGMPVLRENLLRRLAFVERALQLVVPATEKTTYGKGAGLYGSGVRQSGSLKGYSA